MDLPAFRITYNDGTSYVTNFTLAQATAYFLGQPFTDENPETGAETTRTVIAVEEV